MGIDKNIYMVYNFNMKSVSVQSVNEFRYALSRLKEITIDLLLFDLKEYEDIMFQPKLYIKTKEYDSHYDFELYGEKFLNNQFISNALTETVVYKRGSDGEMYGYVFCQCDSSIKYIRHSIIDGNLLGVIYMKE